MIRFWRELKQNPIYLRETGRWGEPNPFFATLNRYSPFIILGTLLLTICSCGSNFSAFGAGDNSQLAAFWILICLPNLMLQALTWAGIILTPALTAPAVAEEMKRGTWEILRLTPIPTWQILVAKMLGSLARLKIWWPLLIASILQAMGAALGLLTAISTFEEGLSATLWALTLAITLLIRPWAEIGFAAVVGITISTWAHSARTALAGSYTAVVAMKLINTSLLWGGIGFAFGVEDYNNGFVVFLNVAPTATYVIASLLISWVLLRRANYLDMGHQIIAE